MVTTFENTRGRVLGQRVNVVYHVEFEDAAEAEAFRHRWLNK
jgi:hypothetical protein